ncbi:hypothetical protein MVEN_00184600 [Mycena venus]|uniref:Uncharacterized protein n=1 Tax=Mycena venus TaxID=2733690 RepID=A0A8H7DD64_9AGAR|nr:hypothetical protein MVEN_00184600 [Mycena venus]
MNLVRNCCLLPVELEREIFELTAFLHPECMLALVLVARRVKIWIKPMLYQTISVHQHMFKCEFSRLPLRAVAKLITSQPVALRYHTRHICFAGVQMSEMVVDLLSRCGVAENLAFIKTPCPAALLPILGALPLQRLSLALSHSFQLFPWPNPFDGRHSIFSQLTHLDILDPHVEIDEWRTWSGLAQIPRLTHLSTRTHMSESVLHGVLQHCKLLQVLVWVYGIQELLDENRARAELTDDPRFVTLVSGELLLDWEAGARGGEDYWARANALVKKRRSEGQERILSQMGSI